MGHLCSLFLVLVALYKTRLTDALRISSVDRESHRLICLGITHSYNVRPGGWEGEREEAKGSGVSGLYPASLHSLTRAFLLLSVSILGCLGKILFGGKRMFSYSFLLRLW